MLDAVIFSLPYTNLDQIQSAPAILSGVLNHNGFKSKGFDFGTELFELCNRDVDLFYETQNYFLAADQESNTIVEEFYQRVLDILIANPARYIGISVFSVWSHRGVFELAHLIRQSNINSKIIVGGRGLPRKIHTAVFPAGVLTLSEKQMKFADVLRAQGLVDHVIVGDGEDALLELFQGRVEKDLTLESDQFKNPTPDYENYHFDRYQQNEKLLPITGSKGCVKDCDFCDVRDQFGTYRYRTGADIAQEVLRLKEQYVINKFQFTDSLVNGSQKELINFCNIIADYNSQNPADKIKWTGQWICRPQNQIKDNLYEIIAASGGEGLTVGMESGSDSVLTAMNKKTNVTAMFDELEQFRQHGINCTLLTFVGHHSETFDNFKEHCQTIIRMLPYVRSGTISAIAAGEPMLMLDGTPALNDPNIVRSDFAPDTVWVSRNNPTNTYKERLARRIIIHNLFTKYKIPSVLDFFNYHQADNTIRSYADQINKFHALSY
jgi:hypothetical protein|tara:strand:- start:689 stop:2167 length:1479 start_codon:yes stop_codon:yes gene_type:complete